jgi:ribosomal subunit interface protein
MQVTIKGKQMDVGESLRAYVEEQLGAIAGKYFSDTIEATVVISHEAHLYKADIQMHVGRGVVVQTEGEATECYPAFDLAAEKMTSRVKRYKSRLRDHHQKDAQREIVNQYVLESNNEAEEVSEGQPAIVAEMETTIGVMTVAEAVMYMDLAGLPAMMFRNSAHGGLNMLYRRADGNVGWVDPRGNNNVQVAA